MKFSIPQSNLKFKTKQPAKSRPLRIVPVFAHEKPYKLAHELKVKKLESGLKIYWKQREFEAKEGQSLYLADASLLLLGLGELENLHPEKIAALFRNLGLRMQHWSDKKVQIHIRPLLELQLKRFSKISQNRPADVMAGKKSPKSLPSGFDYTMPYDLAECISQAITCLLLGNVRMDVLKTQPGGSKINSPKNSQKGKQAKKRGMVQISFYVPGLKKSQLQKSVSRGRAIGELCNRTRYVDHLPGNYLNPASYEKYARALAREYDLNIKVFHADELERMGCGGIVAVGKGSAIAPRMIVVKYEPKNRQIKEPLMLVGKGVTFDTGGISLKPPADMHEMKFDMCGAAVALHSVALAAARKLPLPVVGLIGLAENMPDGKAIKPGDVYTALSGKTVEVQNTDAEGRLVLGDLLTYAQRKHRPLLMLDFATLTGACIIALGHHASAVMTDNEALYQRLEQASKRSLDRLWRLPHWDVYGAGLKSDIADMRNIAGRTAGTVSAMRFLARFIEPETCWAHVDIAGTAWRAKGAGSQTGGATAWGIRLMNQFMEDLLEKN